MIMLMSTKDVKELKYSCMYQATPEQHLSPIHEKVNQH